MVLITRLVGLLILSAFVIFPRAISAEPSAGTIKVGAVLSLTGAAASFGNRTLHGLQLAQDEINQGGEFRLELLVEDSASQSIRAVAGLQKLLSSNQLELFIGDVRSDLILAMAPITQRNRVLLFTTVAGAEEISQAGDLVFRNFEGNLSHGIAMAQFLWGRKLRKVGLFVAQASNAASFAKAFKREFELQGGTVVETIEYLPSEVDFRTFISRTLSHKPDAIYVAPTMGGDAGVVVKQIREAQFSGPIAGGLPVESVEFLDAAGSAAEGVFLSSPSFDEQSAQAQSFRQRFRSKFGSEAEWVEANAYDALKLIIDGISKCGSGRIECVRDFLYQTQRYQGVSGVTSFDPNGDVSKPLIIRVVQNRTFRKIEPEPLAN